MRRSFARASFRASLSVPSVTRSNKLGGVRREEGHRLTRIQDLLVEYGNMAEPTAQCKEASVTRIDSFLHWHQQTCVHNCCIFCLHSATIGGSRNCILCRNSKQKDGPRENEGVKRIHQFDFALESQRDTIYKWPLEQSKHERRLWCVAWRSQ